MFAFPAAATGAAFPSPGFVAEKQKAVAIVAGVDTHTLNRTSVKNESKIRFLAD
jgi:hypothetical protein